METGNSIISIFSLYFEIKSSLAYSGSYGGYVHFSGKKTRIWNFICMFSLIFSSLVVCITFLAFILHCRTVDLLSQA